MTAFQIIDFKSFRRCQELHLSAGFIVIVGQNDVGKTALVEALSLRFNNKPHRSMRTLPRPEMHDAFGTSNVEIAFQLNAGEAEQLLIDTTNQFFVYLNQGADMSAEATSFHTLLRGPNILQSAYQPSTFTSAYLEAYGEQTNIHNLVRFTIDRAQNQINQDLTNKTTGVGQQFQYGFILANALRERIYHFKAERLNISVSSFGMNTVLASDASNLPEVLHRLQSGNPVRFRRFNEHVSTIFPEIKGITLPPGPAEHQVQILVWSIDPDTEREDLAIPLSESGTGIGQVLAMLYALLTSQYPRTIIIDEPQSFLNPGAVRKLLEILKQYSQHQFIITTHSPEIVSIVNPQTLFLLRKVEVETMITQLDSAEAQDQKLLLSEVGARLSDVFGADNILWVEGATEEVSFPLIVEKVLRKPLQGTKIIGVIQTGDFESRHSRLILQIYDRLSRGSGLIPPAVGFIFDREGRHQQAQEDLIRQSQSKAVFLPRRMYENYLLNPLALAAVVSAIGGFRGSRVTPAE